MATVRIILRVRDTHDADTETYCVYLSVLGRQLNNQIEVTTVVRLPQVHWFNDSYTE